MILGEGVALWLFVYFIGASRGHLCDITAFFYLILRVRAGVSAVSACRSEWCRPHEACIISDGGDATCQCPTTSMCQGADDQLCADNGQTYSSRCELRVDECAANRLIRVLERGPCMY